MSTTAKTKTKAKAKAPRPFTVTVNVTRAIINKWFVSRWDGGRCPVMRATKARLPKARKLWASVQHVRVYIGGVMFVAPVTNRNGGPYSDMLYADSAKAAKAFRLRLTFAPYPA